MYVKDIGLEIRGKYVIRERDAIDRGNCWKTPCADFTRKPCGTMKKPGK